MKIDNSISNYYFSQRRAQSGPVAPLEENGNTDARPRLSPTVAPASTSASLSNAFWISATREEEAKPSIGTGEQGDTVGDEFLKRAKMSFAEQIRAQILEAHGITEDELKAMDATQREAIEEEIRKAVERAMGIDQQRDDTASDIADGSPAA
ncbi:hypothetical protein HT585_04740 [Ensifer sp. HO-A22]|uniref:Uncharacterized protein n=1 Tax=Ensifer oleiphilus TaxID=2742698 RepID=A0A7Y6Q370_9HYPH|nr:hypothetical protein [Ensifer oleiphilus]NVD38150.1 hypothetical protein [Ensifer oleiphilus]